MTSIKSFEQVTEIFRRGAIGSATYDTKSPAFAGLKKKNYIHIKKNANVNFSKKITNNRMYKGGFSLGGIIDEFTSKYTRACALTLVYPVKYFS